MLAKPPGSCAHDLPQLHPAHLDVLCRCAHEEACQRHDNITWALQLCQQAWHIGSAPQGLRQAPLVTGPHLGDVATINCTQWLHLAAADGSAMSEVLGLVLNGTGLAEDQADEGGSSQAHTTALQLLGSYMDLQCTDSYGGVLCATCREVGSDQTASSCVQMCSCHYRYLLYPIFQHIIYMPYYSITACILLHKYYASTCDSIKPWG